MDFKKQIKYWTDAADNDIITAEVLITNSRNVEGLFFCHLSIEKILKALIVKVTDNFAPRSHDLFLLSDVANVALSEEQTEFMQLLMKYQLEGRYPEFMPKSPSKDKIEKYLFSAKELLQWFKNRL